MSVGLERVYERNSWANRLYLLLCFAFLFDFPGEEVGVCLICRQTAARHLVRKLPGMIWNFTIYSIRDRIALDTTTLDTAFQIIQGIRSVVIDKIKHFTPPTFSSDTPPTCLFDEAGFLVLLLYDITAYETRSERHILTVGSFLEEEMTTESKGINQSKVSVCET